MSEYIVNVPDEEAEYFIARFEFENVKLMGYSLTGEIVRCRDCRFFEPEREPEESKNSVFVINHPAWCNRTTSKVELDGFCKWAKRKEVG